MSPPPKLSFSSAFGTIMLNPSDNFRRLPIYEASLTLSTPAGKFSQFEARLPEIQHMGIGIIWFTPLFPRGGNPIGKPQSDSEYCVRDYFDLDPRFGTKSDFKHLVKQIHALGMKVIMDFVPNHSSWGNPLIREHPEFYAKDSHGNIVNPDPWTDVAQFDFRNHALWEYMANAHQYWLREFGIDGFREDAAERVPLEFWKWLRPRLDAIKPVYLLAEAENPKLMPAFDTDYDWTLQAYLYMISRGDWPASSLDRMLKHEREIYPKGFARMRHLDNHDMAYTGYAWPNREPLGPGLYGYLENTSLTQKYGPGLRAFAVLTATLPNSQPMIWNGEEIGILDHTPRPIRWVDSPLKTFYRELFGAYRRITAIQARAFQKIQTGADDDVYAFQRGKGPGSALIVLNLSKNPHTIAVGQHHGTYREQFTGDRVRFEVTTRLHLKPWDYRLYLQSDK